MNLYSILRVASEQYKLDYNFILAIAQVESNMQWPKCSVRFEPGWRYFVDPAKYALMNGTTVDTEKMLQSCSYGPLQLMGTCAREMDFMGCLLEVFQPSIGVDLACKKLARLSLTFESEEAIASAWNSGSAKKNPDGTWKDAVYVEKVMGKLKSLRGA
jgi:hypothetical protein